MRYTIFILLLTLFFGSNCQAQSDTSDLNLSIDSVNLLTSMDSLLFGSGNYSEYKVDFHISDTIAFGSFVLEFTSESGQLFFKKKFTLNELQADSLIDNNWDVSINVGRYETTGVYQLALQLLNFNGVSQALISKEY